MPPRNAVGTFPYVTPHRTYVLEVPFEMRAVASANGARWDADLKATVYRGTSLPAGLRPFRSAPYSVERRAEDRLNGGPDHSADDRPVEKFTPRPHQLAAVKAVHAAVKAKRPGFLIADEVGLGKTISAWESVRRMGFAKKVLVVCPLAVMPHWRHTIAAVGDGDKEVIVTTYERMKKLVEAPAYPKGKEPKRTRTKNKRLAEKGEPERFDVIIWDEAHKCRHATSQRSKLAVRFNQKAKFVIWMSATAGQNPLELSYLSPLLAQVTGSTVASMKDFEGWCQKVGFGVTRGAYGKWEWAGDPEDCERARSMLFDSSPPAGIRRLPQDVAGWPEINRILTPVELEGDDARLYNEAWNDFRRELKMAVKKKDSDMALVVKLRFRQKASLLRTGGTVEHVLDLLDNGHQVAVSVAFLETLHALREELEAKGHDCAVISGEPGVDKERERKSFQTGERKVVLFTPAEGISLHQGESGGNDVPRSQVIHDLRWSAIEMAQIEGRTHRDGKFSQMYWMYGDGTVEEDIARVVAGRVASMKEMVGDDTETIKQIEALLSSAGVD